MSTTLPPIGAKVRAVRTLNGTTVTAEGVITSAYGRGYDTDPDRVPPSIVLNGNEHVSMHDYTVHEGTWKTTVEILSKPEPADGSWVTTPSREARPPYVFHRDDAASPYDDYRWWFHEDGDWIAWSEVEKHGTVTVIKDGAA